MISNQRCRGTAIVSARYVVALVAPKETIMTRTVFAMAVVGLLLTAVSGTSQAAPVAPLAGASSTQSGFVTKVWYHHQGAPSVIPATTVPISN